MCPISLLIAGAGAHGVYFAALLMQAALSSLSCGPKPFLDGLRRLEPSPIVKLIRISALVEELLAAVTFIANVDEIAFGDRGQRAPMTGRPPLIRIIGIGTRQLR